MSKIEQLLLLILDRAHKAGTKDLSKFQLFKIAYLLQVISLKYAGTFLIPDIIFVRDKNGPISVNIYSAIEKLICRGYVKKEVIENKEYGYPRDAHSLAKKIPKLSFSLGETIFLDNFLAKLLPLTQKKLKNLVYKTEPMRAIIREEKGVEVKKGAVLDFTSVIVDSDVVESYSDLS
ncbi:hypothetical protein KJ866_04715 [Patescibacteria group bacterium]|nr:hypothetical protein [Patescibacteria group bacterium]